MNRTATAIFGLIYPAVLGTLLFGLFQNPQSSRSSSALALVLLVYFTLQFVQGQRIAGLQPEQSQRDYAAGDLLADLAEIVTMLAAFTVLDFFPPAAAINDWLPRWVQDTQAGNGAVLAAVFALPVLVRWIDTFGTGRKWWHPTARPVSGLPESESRIFLPMMSMIAGLGGFIYPRSNGLGVVIIIAAMTGYWWLYLRSAAPEPQDRSA